MVRLLLLLGIFLYAGLPVLAQFPPQYPVQGNEAISADDPDIIAWATECSVVRGWKNISDTTLGKTSVGDSTAPLGAPDISVLSLGDGGIATLTFEPAITNGPGADFAVFENGFNNPVDSFWAYLEFAFVEVSSDGIHYVRFPVTSNTQDTQQIDNFTYMDASKVNNLAGKYVTGWGTPFDLEVLSGKPNLDVDHIRYIRIIDVVGSLDSAYASYDKNGHIINDPFPSPYPSGGFDLSAIAVIHQQQETEITTPALADNRWRIWPNPASGYLVLENNAGGETSYTINDLTGRLLLRGQFQGKIRLSLTHLMPGIYFVRCMDQEGSNLTKICVQ